MFHENVSRKEKTMKVKDILEHSNAVNTTIATTIEPFTVLCEIDYTKGEFKR